MSLFRRGIRRETLPRKRPEPEANKVQAPEVVRSLQQLLGLRQMHTAPSVGSEILPVAIVANATASVDQIPQVFAQFGRIDASVGPAQIILWNPRSNQKILKVKRLSISPPHGNIINLVTANIGDTAPPATIKRGQPISKGDLPAGQVVRDSTQAGIVVLEGAVIGLGTWYEQFIPDGISTPGTYWPFERTFDGLYLGPGSEMIAYTDGPPGDILGHYEWEEIPL